MERDCCAEFGEALDLLSSGAIDTNAVISEVVGLKDGPEVFRRLAHEAGDRIKAVLVKCDRGRFSCRICQHITSAETRENFVQ